MSEDGCPARSGGPHARGDREAVDQDGPAICPATPGHERGIESRAVSALTHPDGTTWCRGRALAEPKNGSSADGNRARLASGQPRLSAGGWFRTCCQILLKDVEPSVDGFETK